MYINTNYAKIKYMYLTHDVVIMWFTMVVSVSFLGNIRQRNSSFTACGLFTDIYAYCNRHFSPRLHRRNGYKLSLLSVGLLTGPLLHWETMLCVCRLLYASQERPHNEQPSLVLSRSTAEHRQQRSSSSSSPAVVDRVWQSRSDSGRRQYMNRSSPP